MSRDRAESILLRLLDALERRGALGRLGRGKHFDELVKILARELRECSSCEDLTERLAAKQLLVDAQEEKIAALECLMKVLRERVR